ncbi:uncharacterized protein [Parasteatoda tepidariorum]|uniref:uncharacterized protein n=1 Tax=Parasteatoda tepidariorum TaxID=114398 RepID=UPI001C71AAD1|nr:uncharacterized protein LOC107437538 [Parasteatoda tepidariorum]
MKGRGVDSRRSWVVAIACGVVFSLINCPMRLGAQLFVSLKDCYGTSRNAASLPFELAYFTRSISGPLAGYFGERIGLQKVTAIGCLTSAAGMFACYFANNIITIDIFLGLVFGIGYGWATAVVPEIINQHFIEHRTKGNGIVFGASGLSGFLTPPLLVFVLNTYGQSASFLIISGIILNTIPAVMLLTKPDEEKVPESKTTEDNFENQKLAKQKNTDSETAHKLNIDMFKEKNILVPNDSHHNQTPKLEDTFSKDTDKHILYNPSFTSVQNSTNNLVGQRNEFDSTKLNSTQINRPIPVAKIIELNVNDLTNQLTSVGGKNTYFNPIDSVPKDKAETSMCESINILWTPTFLLITFVQSSHFYIMYMFWTITVDIVRDKGVQRELEVYFVMALSLFDTIGRFFLACVTDCTRLTAAHFSSVCFAMIGLSCLLLVWVSGFEATLLAICLLGLIVGGNTTSLPGIVNGFIEKEKRPLAMASRLLMYAPMSFTMSPLIGYFREVLSSYNGLLYIMMSMCFACSIVLQILSHMHNTRKKTAQFH